TAFKLSSLGVAALSVAIGLGTARAAQQPAAADAIDRVMQDALVRGRLASLTAQVRRGGQIIFSKSMTAYCIFTLVSEGKLKLSDRLSDILPDYPGPGGQATILQLLTHTSGIPDYAGDS